MAACGLETGKIYLWTVNTPQRWSALAPDFAEVEENVEYIEREDEFDIHPSAVLQQRRLDLEDEDVDVLTIEPIKADDDDDDLERNGASSLDRLRRQQRQHVFGGKQPYSLLCLILGAQIHLQSYRVFTE